jgi:NAD(P)-dependent dehydrogenase (short-subunit alcohol dehydrogenase family)
MTEPWRVPSTGVLITGGASGIGLASADAVAAVGRSVALVDHDGDRAHDAAERITHEHGVDAVGLAVDVTGDADVLAEAVAACGAAIGPIGGMVHAAGAVLVATVDEITVAQWDSVVDVNLRAYVMMSQAVLPEIRRAGPGGSIVGIASIEALVGQPAIPAYCASKAGVLGATRSMAQHLAPEGIRVNAVCPGYVRTPMLAPALTYPGVEEHMIGQTPLGRLAEPMEIGRVIRFLLSDESSYVTGIELAVDGGLTHRG